MMSKWGRRAVPWQAQKSPAYWLRSIRCEGSRSPSQTISGNVRTCFRHVSGNRGGLIRSSDEKSVMGLERRDGDHIHCRRHNPKGDDVTDATKIIWNTKSTGLGIISGCASQQGSPRMQRTDFENVRPATWWQSIQDLEPAMFGNMVSATSAGKTDPEVEWQGAHSGAPNSIRSNCSGSDKTFHGRKACPDFPCWFIWLPTKQISSWRSEAMCHPVLAL